MPRTATQLEPFDPLNSGRVKIGVFIEVVEGRLVAFLVDGSGVRIGDRLRMRRGDFGRYRLFHVPGIEATGSVAIRLRSGKSGARFVVRDL